MRRRSWAFPLIVTLLLVPQSAVRAGARAPSAPPVPLESHFDNRGISADDRPSGADLDGRGASLPAAALASAGWTPGRSLTVDGTRLTWPATVPGAPDNVLADGQRVLLSGRGDALTFLVTSTAGRTARGDGEITYGDGTRAPYTLAAPDWRRGSPAAKALALPHVNTPSGRRPARARVYAVTVPLDPARAVASVRLPVASGLHVFAAAIRANPSPWTGTWATAHSGLPAEGPWTDRTLRLVVHTSAGGTRVRLRFANTFADTPVRIGAATVALRAEKTASPTAPRTAPTAPRTVPDPPAGPPAPGAALSGAGAATEGAPVPVLFGGSAGVEIPAGAQAVSDPLDLAVPAGADLLVSFHLPGTVTALPTHRYASQRSYVSAPGDHTADRAGTAYTSGITGWPLLTGVDVEGGPGTVVLLGDSITDGYLSTTDANRRWPDALAARLRGQRAVPAYGVLNAGIAGNRVAADGYAGDGVSPVASGVSALARLERDALAQPSVRTLVVFEGINDLRRGGSADDVTDGLREIAERARERGISVLGATLLPCAGDLRCTPEVQEDREKVNAWIRDGDAFDAVLDFDAALRDPTDPSRLLPAYDSGDRLHPSDAGYAALAAAVDLTAL
ncbi:SGNH/GDSL hydrolase family protein [Streptomyces roseirectus]|uniref:SGNH/GDSL hydrolase family protein n=1 Tax=Streptomyces roseirectus TaxID=2768066 RepID=A0A7H0I962_9ACTN|nr:SGNH/GDSL hydrolase family protein [Streptomyces roseirectus]QNP69328.1 SGNH/GDSL hydrolase family protein [Streptomyces roseirectus]